MAACAAPEPTPPPATPDIDGLMATMQTHLDAVSGRDLDALAATLSPTGEMRLILEDDDVLMSADSFLAFHEGWFADTSAWSFTTKIRHAEAGEPLGVAIVEALYEEPERDGRPYFNQMIISYTLRQENRSWYVIKDHATSVVKSTDGGE